MEEFIVGTEIASDRAGPPSRGITRRAWLQGGLALIFPAMARSVLAQEPKRAPLRPEEQKVLDAVEAREESGTRRIPGYLD